eukprot:6472870-Amphidinium_carterae.1
MRRYAARIAAFQKWLTDQELGDVRDLVKDGAQLNAALLPFLQGLYNAQQPPSHGSYLLAGLQLYYPQTIGRLQPSWQLQKQWNQLSPSESRTPLPVEVLLALVSLLRPGEIGSAKRGHLTLPSDTSGALDSGVFAILKPKTARTTLLQSVVIEDPKLLLLSEAVLGEDPAESLWLRGGLPRLQSNFNFLKQALCLQRTPYTLGSLRAGGAVEFLRRTRDSAGLQIRGRWASQKSMFHYTQLSLAAVSVHNIPVVKRERIFALARMASTLLDLLQWQGSALSQLQWGSPCENEREAGLEHLTHENGLMTERSEEPGASSHYDQMH